MAARPRPNSVEYGNSKTTVHCCPRLNVRVHSSKVELAAARLCVFGGLWVDMWRLVQQRWFLLFWLSFDCFWYTVGTVLVDMWRLVHQWSFLLFDCLLTVFDGCYTVGTNLVDMWRLVHLCHFCCFDCLLTVFDGCYTVGTNLVDMWRLVHLCHFCCFCYLLTVFDCFWRLVHCWCSLGRHVTIGTPMVIFAVLTVSWLFLTITVPIITGLPRST